MKFLITKIQNDKDGSWVADFQDKKTISLLK